MAISNFNIVTLIKKGSDGYEAKPLPWSPLGTLKTPDAMCCVPGGVLVWVLDESVPENSKLHFTFTGALAGMQPEKVRIKTGKRGGRKKTSLYVLMAPDDIGQEEGETPREDAYYICIKGVGQGAKWEPVGDPDRECGSDGRAKPSLIDEGPGGGTGEIKIPPP